MKRHRLGVAPATRPNSDINITPLVDVVLVLLIIFMVVTPLAQTSLPVDLPERDESGQVPVDVQVVVGVTASGALSINAHPVASADYVEALRALLGSQPTGPVVFFAADEGANYAKVVEALDGARRAGAPSLALMTQLEAR